MANEKLYEVLVDVVVLVIVEVSAIGDEEHLGAGDSPIW